MEEQDLLNNIAQEEVETEDSVVEEQEVTLDDLDKIPEAAKFRIITERDEVPEVLTISNVKLGKALTKNDKGDFVEPEVNNKGNKYYKAKLIVEVEEKINGDSIRTFIPSIFYSVQENGELSKIPTIPKSCSEDKLDDNFTSELAKLRTKYCTFKGLEPKLVSSADFLKGLIGMKFKPEIKTGEYPKGRPYVKMSIKEFC